MDDHFLLYETNELCEMVEQVAIEGEQAKTYAEQFLDSGAATQESKVFLKAFIDSFTQ